VISRGLELLWREIESSHKPREGGWVRRLVNPGSVVSVHAAVASNSGTRSLMIDIPARTLGILNDLPVTGGLSVSLTPPLEGVPGNQRSLAVELDDAQYSDIFAVFCTDLVDRISQCAKVNDATVLLLARLERWQEFLSRTTSGLSQNEVVGLFGELWLLKNILVPLGGIGLVGSWTGARRSPQDFIVPSVCAVEVKTTTAQALSHVRIHGERQLDDSGLSCLFLACLRTELDPDGESLNDIVHDLRRQAAVTPEFSSKFDKLLTEAGWLERHMDRYEQVRFRVAQSRFFRVDHHFPRLLAANIAPGIDEVDYRLDLRNCRACECDRIELELMLSSLQLCPNFPS